MSICSLGREPSILPTVRSSGISFYLFYVILNIKGCLHTIWISLFLDLWSQLSQCEPEIVASSKQLCVFGIYDQCFQLYIVQSKLGIYNIIVLSCTRPRKPFDVATSGDEGDILTPLGSWSISVISGSSFGISTHQASWFIVERCIHMHEPMD